jgi:hypothetical protein
MGMKNLFDVLSEFWGLITLYTFVSFGKVAQQHSGQPGTVWLQTTSLHR